MFCNGPETPTHWKCYLQTDLSIYLPTIKYNLKHKTFLVFLRQLKSTSLSKGATHPASEWSDIICTHGWTVNMKSPFGLPEQKYPFPTVPNYWQSSSKNINYEIVLFCGKSCDYVKYKRRVGKFWGVGQYFVAVCTQPCNATATQTNNEKNETLMSGFLRLSSYLPFEIQGRKLLGKRNTENLLYDF